MSIEDLFRKKTVVFDSYASASVDAESSEFISSSIAENQTFLPVIDFGTASNFVKYGSAELYYENAIKRIYQRYPYDGSLSEKNEYHLSSSALDRWIYNYKYPKTTGYINLGTTGQCTDNDDQGYYQSAPTSTTPNSCTSGVNEYIRVNGGIHTASVGMEGTPLADVYDDAVIYHTASNRTTSLRMNFQSGSTIEFWLKKDSFAHARSEVIFDAWNGVLSSSSGYGRLKLYMDTYGYTNLGNNSPLFVTVCSSSTPIDNTSAGRIAVKNIGKNIGSSVAPYPIDWTHIAVSFLSESNGMRVKTYVNGEENDDQLLGSIGFNEVTGAITANIGALRATPPSDSATANHGANDHDIMNGYGKLSASLDEFRYWKVKRTSEEIQKNYWHPIGGGQNKKHPDEQLRNLGVYFKFNEGITGTSSTDSAVLDYSGRIANGNWVGFPGSVARNTGSAFVSASVLTSEPPDPIIYSSHPEVVSLSSEMQESGSLHDRVSGSFLYETIPHWIREEDTKGNTKALFQIMSSYFDTLHSQITELTKLQEKRYFNIDNPDYEVRPTDFAKKMLDGRGLLVPELFPNTSVLEYFMQRNEDKIKFDHSINDIKNMIYQNIYNNLEYIFKSKGTHEGYRNLLRCFGIDDEILKLNMYTDKGIHYFRDNVRHTSVKKKYINFNSLDKIEATVYQTASTSGGNTFIAGTKTASSYERYSSFTYEVDLIVPFKVKPGLSGYYSIDFVTASIFGQHEAKSTASDYTWGEGPVDDAAFQVYLIREESNSENAYFMLTSSVLGVELKTPTYYKIYDNERWNLAVRIKPEHFPFDGGVTSQIAPSYVVEFYGINYALDNVRNEFDLSTTISNALGSALQHANKRVYMGAYRTNFTGSVLQKTDLQIGSLRVWMDYLDNSVIKQHALDPFNYGASKNAFSNSTMFTYNLSGSHIPKYDSLVLFWQLDTLTGSDSSGFLAIDDFSSGSSDSVYGWVDNIIREKHPAKGQYFPASSTSPISNEFIFASRKQLPEVSVSYDRIFVKEDEEKYFIEDDDLSDNFYSLEKSFYANVSEEMLDTFSTVAELSNLMGKYQDRYKRNYTKMDHLRKLFFERVDGDLDFDQFTSYFKWIDSSISTIVRQLVPISARISPDVSNMIEDHMLERNKYDNKFPLLEREVQDPKFGSIKAINELNYNWKFGHAPIETVIPETATCLFIDNHNQVNSVEYLKTEYSSLDGGNSTLTTFAPTDFTISMWLNPSSLMSSKAIIFALHRSNTFISPIQIGIGSNNKLFFTTIYSGDMITWEADALQWGNQLPLDQWSHISIVFNGSATNGAQSDSTVTFYTNGSPYSGTINRTTSGGSFPTGSPDSYEDTSGWLLGVGMAGGAFEFIGKIDDLAVWKTLLSSSEVSAAYNSATPVDLKTVQASNILAWWRMGDSHHDTDPPQLTVYNEIDSNFPLEQIGEAGAIEFQTGVTNVYSTTVLASSDPTFDNRHCLWWDERALRDHDVTTSNSTNDEQRETIRKLSTFEVSSSSPIFSKTDNTIYSGSAYAIRRFSKPYKLTAIEQPVIHAGTNYDRRKNRDIIHNAVHIHGPYASTGVPSNIVLVGALGGDGLTKEIDCVDIEEPTLDSSGTSIIARKKKRNSAAIMGREYEDEKHTLDRILPGDMVLPFNIYSSSTDGMDGTYKAIRFTYAKNIIFTNLHSDTYGNQNDIGLQGPFSDTWVGGHQHRHVPLNHPDANYISYTPSNNPQKPNPTTPPNNLADLHTRPEAWYIYHQSAGNLEDPLGNGPDTDGIIGVVGPDYGFGYPSPFMKYAYKYRDERAKRPFNIRNIKTIRPQFDSTGSYLLNTDGIHRQSHPYFHSSSGQSHKMTGSARLGNFYSNYEVVQTTGRSTNNLYLRKAFGSADVDGQESPFLPEAMKSANSEIYSGNTLLTNATHYSSLYGRRPSVLHTQANHFLRTPSAAEGIGHLGTKQYCVDFTQTPDSGLSIRRLFTNLHQINGTGILSEFCFSMWFGVSLLSLGNDRYTILAKFGDNSLDYTSEVHLCRKSTGDMGLRIVIGGSASIGVWESTVDNLESLGTNWNHVVIEFTATTQVPRVFLEGQEVELTQTQTLDGYNSAYQSEGHLCMSETTTTYKVDMTNTTTLGPTTLSKYVGYLGDCFMVLHKSQSTGFSDRLLKRFYNRGHLCDPTTLTDREVLFWFGMGRGPSDKLLSQGPYGTNVSVYDSSLLEMEDGIKIFNLVQKTAPHIDIILDQQGTGGPSDYNQTTTENSFKSRDGIGSGPLLVDNSGYHWEYAFDKNPSLTGSNSDSVFVNRFSSPGGPEVMSRGFLDAAAGEYSVYNALPWRNLSVRGFKPKSGPVNYGVIFPIMEDSGPFNGTNSSQSGIHVVDHHNEFDGLVARLARHSGIYGTDPKKVRHIDITNENENASFLEERFNMPSWHKQQRNISRVPTTASTISSPEFREIFDNAYLNTPIPRSDFQYSWITDSLGQDYNIHSGKQRVYGYTPRNGEAIVRTPTTVNGSSHLLQLSSTNIGYRVNPLADLTKFYNQQWTFAAWIRPDFSGLSTFRNFLYKVNMQNPQGATMQTSIYISGNVAKYLYVRVPSVDGTWTDWYIPFDSYYDQRWLHVAVSFDGSEEKISNPIYIYINGIKVNTTQSGTWENPSVTTWNFPKVNLYCMNITGNGYNFVGAVDETVVYNRALNNNEIEKIYNLGKAYDYKDKSAVYGVSAWWRFGDSNDFQGDSHNVQDSAADGSQVRDRSGSELHLKVANTGVDIFQIEQTNVIGTFDHKIVGKKSLVEAIIFPSASEIIGV